jgi:hypothetical protein
MNNVPTPDPLAPLYGQFPGWHAWVGVSGILYARREKSSPPIVFRAATADELAAQLRAWEAQRETPR